jgi:hypothetical protein
MADDIHCRSSFALPSTSFLVIAGQVVERTVQAGMRVSVPFSQGSRLAPEIASIELDTGAVGPDGALVVACGGQEALDQLLSRACADRVRTVNGRRPAATGKALPARLPEMTEAEWEKCSDPGQMLELLRACGMLSERKSRLFAAACCRRIWEVMTDDRSREAVAVCERYADGEVGRKQLVAARRLASSATRLSGLSAADRVLADNTVRHAAGVALNACRNPRSAKPLDVAESTAYWASRLVYHVPGEMGERAAQCSILRDLFGPPPFLPVVVQRAWLAFSDGLVRSLAVAAYREREMPEGNLDAARLGVLADALADAGCADSELLDHLRGPGPHVRGCRVLDAILGLS